MSEKRIVYKVPVEVKKTKHRDIKSAKNDIGISPSKWIQDH